MSFRFKYDVKLVLLILGMGIFATTGIAEDAETNRLASVKNWSENSDRCCSDLTYIVVTNFAKVFDQLDGCYSNLTNMVATNSAEVIDQLGSYNRDQRNELKSPPVGITFGKSVCLALVVVFLLVAVTVPWAIKTDARMRVMENILKDIFERLGRIHPMKNPYLAKNVGIVSEMKQSVEDACKLIADKIDSLAATIAASKKEDEAKKRNCDEAVENAEALATFIGESAFLKNDKFAPLWNELKSWLSKDHKGADVVASSLGVFAVRESVDDDTWLLSLRNISHGLTAVSQSLGEDSSAAITRLATWSQFLADYSDGGKLFALQIPQIGSAVDFSWMTVAAGKEASRVASVKGWAVYTAYGVRYNAEVA